MAGCATGHQSGGSGVPSVAVRERSSEGLDLLADIPSLKSISSKMSEEQFLDILHRRKIPYMRELGPNHGVSYLVRPKAHVVVVFGFRDGHCSGIQRLAD